MRRAFAIQVLPSSPCVLEVLVSPSCLRDPLSSVSPGRSQRTVGTAMFVHMVTRFCIYYNSTSEGFKAKTQTSTRPPERHGRIIITDIDIISEGGGVPSSSNIMT